MSQGRSSTSAGARGGSRKGSQRTGAPVILAEVGGGRSADEIMEELLRVVQGEVDAGMARAHARDRAVSSAPSSPSRLFCPSAPSSLARGVARRFLGMTRSFSAASSRTGSSPAGSSRGEQASSDLAGTSGSALKTLERTESVQEPRPEPHEVAPTRSDFAAIMRSALALAKVQVDADGSEVQAPFDELQQAMTGLMELTYGKAELPNQPELPHEFATKWPLNDGDPFDSRVMNAPVILASGYSVDESYHRWSCSQTNICPVTNKTLPHSFTFPNNLLRDMIAAWRLDHSLQSSTSTVETLPMAASEEQIEDILRKFSKHSVLQEQALHEIQHLSRITKGEQPCLEKWSVLIQELIDLQENWKTTWTQNLEDLRLAIILNLTVHRPNKEILAGVSQLPDVLKKIAHKLRKHGSPASPLAKVASIAASLSEFEIFRKRMLDIGGMEMLRDLLRIGDVVLRKEAINAILGLCTDQEGEARAASCHVPDLLVECLTITDEALGLLDRLRKDPYTVDILSDKAVELVNIIMAEPVIPKVMHSAISLVHTIVQEDAHRMEEVNNLEDFKKRLQELSSGSLPMQTMLQLDTIISTLLDISPAPARQVQS